MTSRSFLGWVGAVCAAILGVYALFAFAIPLAEWGRHKYLPETVQASNRPLHGGFRHVRDHSRRPLQHAEDPSDFAEDSEYGQGQRQGEYLGSQDEMVEPGTPCIRGERVDEHTERDCTGQFVRQHRENPDSGELEFRDCQVDPRTRRRFNCRLIPS
jgi:hypothetical protein